MKPYSVGQYEPILGKSFSIRYCGREYAKVFRWKKSFLDSFVSFPKRKYYYESSSADFCLVAPILQLKPIKKCVIKVKDVEYSEELARLEGASSSYLRLASKNIIKQSTLYLPSIQIDIYQDFSQKSYILRHDEAVLVEAYLDDFVILFRNEEGLSERERELIVFLLSILLHQYSLSDSA